MDGYAWMHGWREWRGSLCGGPGRKKKETQGPVVVPIQVFQGFAQKKKTQKKILGQDDGCFEKLQKKPEPEEDAETLQVVEDGQDGTSFASVRVGHVAN